MPIQYSLTIKEGPGTGALIVLDQARVIVGRDPSCDLMIDDAEVSRRHARLIARNGGYAIEDLGSTNGTFINEQRIKSVMPLKTGDSIRLGDRVVVGFEATLPEEAETRGLPFESQETLAQSSRPMFAPPLEAPAAPPPSAGPATLLPEGAAPPARRRPRRSGLRLPVFSKPWMLGLIVLVLLGLCMLVFLFFVDVFNLWCTVFGWALSACA